ncbi:NUDIX domain-containing protein [bacterium]|nr:NUDIX domain-containing protein [bacterium]
MKPVSKVLIRTGEHYLFSRKRAPGRKKDRHLEMLGGKLEKNEDPLDALIRETREEEASGLLADFLERERPGYEEVRVDLNVMDEPQYIFRIEMDPALADQLKADPEESHGLEKVKAALFDSDYEMKYLRDQFTRKTVAILRAMGRVI